MNEHDNQGFERRHAAGRRRRRKAAMMIAGDGIAQGEPMGPPSGFDPRLGFGPHVGPGGRRGRHHGRAARGDVRNAVLMLLATEPMHGYQLMQAIADRSQGRWTPSPGAIYPTLNQLEDEGLVEVSSEGGRRMATLTAAGQAESDRAAQQASDPFLAFERGPRGTDLRPLAMELMEAARAVGRGGNEAQREAASKVLAEAKRSLYLILATEPAVEDSAAPEG